MSGIGTIQSVEEENALEITFCGTCQCILTEEII